MSQLKWLVVLLCGAGLFSGCAPSVIVENQTTIPIRVVVTASGASDVVSPSPGESSTVQVTEGAYTASVVTDAEWIEYAKLTRKDLNDQLANSDTLSGGQLLSVVQRLKDIAQRMKQFQDAAGAGASCGGKVSSDSNGVVAVTIGASGKLAISCN